VTTASSRTSADLFALLHLTGVVCGYLDLERSSAVRQAQTGRHWLYVVKRGDCWIEPIEHSREPMRLGADDVLAVANDSSHYVRQGESLSGSRTSNHLVLRAPRAPALQGTHAVVFVASVAVRSAPLSELFPTIFHVPADGSRSNRRIADLVRLMEEEIAGPAEAGSGAVIDHLAELVLIELLRVETHRVNEASPVWVQGIVDPAVARLVTALHAEPGHHWSWDSMGRRAGLSRSALDRRFRAVLGQSPKRYLLALRMRRAAAALIEGRRSIAEIAGAVGYESEPAFHRAFRRTLGLTPGAYARAEETL
jgi:AraC-like DNA-binding protein